jgi:hypothetical protein
MYKKQNGLYKGYRIGKCKARTQAEGGSDYGMEYDGIYWHYIDKFIFALERYAVLTKDSDILNQVIDLCFDMHEVFYIPNQGYLWKINVDCTRIKQHTFTQPNHDAVSAWIVYKIVLNTLKQAQNEGWKNLQIDNKSIKLENIIIDLEPIVNRYFSTKTSPCPLNFIQAN